MNIEYPSLVHTDLTEQVYHILRDKILRRELRPGTQIVIPEVARALNVSRTPVNDALKRLGSEGLVTIKPRKGTFVTELTARDVEELFDIRLMIELYAARRLFELGTVKHFLAASRSAMDAMDRAVDENDYRDYELFISNDRDFHLALVGAAGNNHLMRMYRNMNLHMHVARAYYLKNVEHAGHIQRQHRAIVAAFERGQANDVYEALTTHITEPKERILKVLSEVGGTL